MFRLPCPSRERLAAVDFFRALSLLLCLSLGLFAAPLRAQEVRFLGIRLNGLARAETASVFVLPDRRLAIDAATLDALGLRRPETAAACGGAPCYALDGQAWRWTIEAATQTLILEAGPQAFVEHHLEGDGKRWQNALSPVLPGAFVNYDLQWQRADGRDVGSGFFEVAAFSAQGSGLLTGFWNSASPWQPWVRLDSTWTLDLPERMQSLRFGDAVVQPGSWGRALRFGGLQWSSNFATQPGFVTFPLPALRGEAVQPSTLDLLVNHNRQMHGEVPAGPFEITDVPLVNGAGEVQMLVRDMMGRQQVVSQSYYVSQRLLRPGLRDFSLEFGAARLDYGIASAHYGRLLFAGTERYGVSPVFTRELRAEIQADRASLGAGGVWLLGGLGTASLGLAASHGPNGSDGLLAAGFERRSAGFSFSLRGEYAGRHFERLGVLPEATPRQSLYAQIGMPLGGSGLALGFARQTTWQGGENRVLTASYGIELGRAAYLGFYAFHDAVNAPHLTLGLVLTWLIDRDTHASADLSSRGGSAQTTWQLQRALPPGEGWGYRLLAGSGGVDRADAGAYWRTAQASYSAEAMSYQGMSLFRLGLAGALALTADGAFLSRRIEDSFAVVKVADYAGVRVYRDNLEVARTDAAGRALVTGLRAYQQNPLSIDSADLPLDAEVRHFELKLAPGLRSAVLAEFPVRHVRSARFRIVAGNGQPLPPGTQLRLVAAGADDNASPVGFDGHAFVSGLGERNLLQASWNERRCRAELSLDPAATGIVQLGDVICQGDLP